MDTNSLPKAPQSDATVEVSIIDTSFRISNLPTSMFLGPQIDGYETFSCNAYAFLITHTDAQSAAERKILFDLGPPQDWERDLPEPLVQRIKSWGASIEIQKYVSEILEDGGVSLEGIDTVIWSHPHWDHIGRPSLFPKTTKLLVGPGVMSAFKPGYPENSSSPFLSRELDQRSVEEIDFSSSSLKIGGFEALDYFGDGSFYLLSAPGHAIGHMNALARTTSSSSGSTFILMGGDSFHHPSQMRPHKYTPLPTTISGQMANLPQPYDTCKGTWFESIHPSSDHRSRNIPEHYVDYIRTSHRDPVTSPFCTISQKPTGETLAVDINQARDTIQALQAFDGDPNIFVIAAHDTTLADVVEYLPKTANQWKEKGWKTEGRWRFLGDLWSSVELAKGER